MCSINDNQPEHTRIDLRGREAVAKIKELVGTAKNCFFATAGSRGDTEMLIGAAVGKTLDDSVEGTFKV